MLVCCAAADTLWVEKYKPRNADELVGNGGNVATIRQWLHQWDDVHLRGATPVQPKSGGYQVRLWLLLAPDCWWVADVVGALGARSASCMLCGCAR